MCVAHHNTLQVLGADLPIHERSQLSTPVIFFTNPGSGGGAFGSAEASTVANKTTTMTTTKGTAAGMGKTGTATNTTTTTTATATSAAAARSIAITGNSTTNGKNTKNMSKTKKEIVSAVINGQQLIQIERLNNSCRSHGVSEEYL